MASVPNRRRKGSYKQYLNSKIQVPRNTAKRWKHAENLQEATGNQTPSSSNEDIHIQSDNISENENEEDLSPNGSEDDRSPNDTGDYCSLDDNEAYLPIEAICATDSVSDYSKETEADLQSEPDCESDEFSDFNTSHEHDSDEETQSESEPLYEGSAVSTNHAVMAILQYYVSNNISKQGLDNLLKLIDNLLPSPHYLPKSKYHLDKFINKYAPPVQHFKHEYCLACHFYIGTSAGSTENEISENWVCSSCSTSTKKGYFLTYELSDLLKNFLENGEASKHIFARPGNNESRGLSRTSESKISDVCDGYCYSYLKRELQLKSTDLTLIWNTDGIPVFKSSQAQLWPVQISIAEICPKVRQNFILVCGLWFGHEKPDMNTFLRPFAKNLTSLATDGFEWFSSRLGTNVTSRVVAPLASLDAPARASVMNIHQFNGEFGCPVCDNKGTVIQTGNGHSRIYEADLENEPELKTNSTFVDRAKEAVESDKVVKGVKGPSVMSTVFYFNLAWAFVPDYMHCALLGVVRQFFFLWFDSRHHMKPWSMSTKVSVVDRKLCKIKPPIEVTRLPRSIKTRKFWKASEYRSWLLFYSVPVLQNILPYKYLNHWLLLVFCIFTLLQTSVSSSDIDLCKVLLKIFCMEIGDLYGKEQLTFNVHQLLHLPLSVQRWGPLWATSAFGFESNNGVLLSLIHGTQQINMQLVNTLKFVNGYNVLSSMLKNPLGQSISSVTLLGKPIYIQPSDLEKLKLSNFFSCNINELQIFSRCKIRGTLFSSKCYKRTNRCNYAVKYNIKNVKNSSGTSLIGYIKYFVQYDCGNKLLIACVVERYDIVNSSFFKHRDCNLIITHLIPLSVEHSGIDIVPLEHIENKMICLTEGLVSYFPNEYEHNL